MRNRSGRLILGAGFVVLVAQLVVWLTPARNLIVDTAENRPALDAAGQSRTTAPSALRPENQGESSELAVVEPSTSAGETMSQAPTVPEPEVARGVNGAGTGVAPTAADETMAQAPILPEPKAESDVNGAGAEVAPSAAGETVSQAPTSSAPEFERDVSEADVEETPPVTDETLAQAPTVPEAEVTREAGVEEAPPVTDEAVAQAPTVAEPEMKRDVSEAGTGEMPSATNETQAGASSAEIVFNAESRKRKLSEPTLRKGVHADDLAALEAFYAAYDGPARWVTSAGLSPQAKSIAKEIGNAEDWGLDARALRVPPPDFRPPTAEDQAAVEVALDVAILKYARAAQGRRVEPSAVSDVFVQTPSMNEPKAVLSEIAAASAPDTYLTALHPKHEQFAGLRQALLKAQSEEDKKRLRANMDRWRQMPQNLGDTYVWLNIPEFMLHVVKDGKTIASEKVVVGNLNNKTPVLSADMKSLVFNPERTVPRSVIRKNVLPKLRERRGWNRGNATAVLEQYQLTVRRRGEPVDPTQIDWEKVDLSKLTFVQASGPTNILGKVKFLYPNERNIFMHEAILPDQLTRAVRSAGRKEPRVANPEKLATLLLAEANGWNNAKVKQAAKGKDVEITLNEPIPVHMTYFTVVVDDDGQLKTFDDVYDLDGFDKSEDSAAMSPLVDGAAPIPLRKPTNGGSASRAQ